MKWLSRSLVAVFVAAALLPLTDAPAGANTLAKVSVELHYGSPTYRQMITSFKPSAGNVSSTPIACMLFTYNTAPDGSGVVPPGLDMSTAGLDGENFLSDETGWGVGIQTAGLLQVTKSSGTTTPNYSFASAYFTLGGMAWPTSTTTAYYQTLQTFTNKDCVTGPVDSVTVAFQTPSSALASVSIDPSIMFGVAGRSTVCNSQAPTSFSTASTGTSVSMGHISDVISAGGAQDLTVGSNAGGGFSVYIRGTAASNNLNDGNGHAVADISGTHASPGTAPVAGTAGFGYTTNDATVAFAANNFAKLDNTNQTVLVGPPPTSTATSCVGFQAAAATTTIAATYSATIIYLMVPSF